jgi:hypothetical protein
MTEKKVIVLGTVTIEPDTAVAFSIPPDLDPDAIAAALVAAEEERAAAQAHETARLREIFLKGERHE